MTRHNMTCHVLSWRDNSWHDMPCHGTPWHHTSAMAWRARECRGMPCCPSRTIAFGSVVFSLPLPMAIDSNAWQRRKETDNKGLYESTPETIYCLVIPQDGKSQGGRMLVLRRESTSPRQATCLAHGKCKRLQNLATPNSDPRSAIPDIGQLFNSSAS